MTGMRASHLKFATTVLGCAEHVTHGKQHKAESHSDFVGGRGSCKWRLSGHRRRRPPVTLHDQELQQEYGELLHICGSDASPPGLPQSR